MEGEGAGGEGYLSSGSSIVSKIGGLVRGTGS